MDDNDNNNTTSAVGRSHDEEMTKKAEDNIQEATTSNIYNIMNTSATSTTGISARKVVAAGGNASAAGDATTTTTSTKSDAGGDETNINNNNNNNKRVAEVGVAGGGGKKKEHTEAVATDKNKSSTTTTGMAGPVANKNNEDSSRNNSNNKEEEQARGPPKNIVDGETSAVTTSGPASSRASNDEAGFSNKATNIGNARSREEISKKGNFVAETGASPPHSHPRSSSSIQKPSGSAAKRSNVTTSTSDNKQKKTSDKNNKEKRKMGRLRKAAIRTDERNRLGSTRKADRKRGLAAMQQQQGLTGVTGNYSPATAPAVTALQKVAAQKSLEEVELDAKSFYVARNPRCGHLESFILRYNELSVSALAKWATNSASSATAAAAGVSASVKGNIPAHPKVNIIFRQCQLCKQFGHYELHCPCPDAANQVQAFRRDIQDSKVKRGRLQRGRGVLVEEYNGIVIEQSKKALPLSYGATPKQRPQPQPQPQSKPQPSTTSLEETELDEFTILAGPNSAFGT